MESIADTELIELDAVLRVIHQHCGYDFRNYSKSSIHRSLVHELERYKLSHMSELIPLILYQPEVLQNVLQRLSIKVTEFFRDPCFFHSLSQDIFPLLRTFPFFKIWHAGCASGEEVYSLAILLEEAGLLDRARIYATDFNHSILAKAKEGIFARNKVEEFAKHYWEAGGNQEFLNYFHSKYNVAKINSHFKRKITFAHHNLVTDSVFGEMQMVVCRNVLIYFDQDLKTRVLKLFFDSLCHGGILCLGSKESLEYLNCGHLFEGYEKKYSIYRKNMTVENYEDIPQEIAKLESDI